MLLCLDIGCGHLLCICITGHQAFYKAPCLHSQVIKPFMKQQGFHIAEPSSHSKRRDDAVQGSSQTSSKLADGLQGLMDLCSSGSLMNAPPAAIVSSHCLLEVICITSLETTRTLDVFGLPVSLLYPSCLLSDLTSENTTSLFPSDYEPGVCKA